MRTARFFFVDVRSLLGGGIEAGGGAVACDSVVRWFGERAQISGIAAGLSLFSCRHPEAPGGAAATETPASRERGGGGRTCPGWRLPAPGASERAFLDELEAHGISPGPDHLPDWSP